MPGYIKNCLVKGKDKVQSYKPAEWNAEEFIVKDTGAEWLFYEDGDNVYAQLDGYAIIPMEEYDRLRALEMPKHTTGAKMEFKDGKRVK